jgi:Plasmid encoded RepA protein
MLRPDVIPLKPTETPLIHKAAILSDVAPENPQFLHALLCQLGLPRKKIAERVFERTSGRASMLIEAGNWYNGKTGEPQPLPYGTRPRLVLIHTCSEAVRTQSPIVDIARSVRAFLARLRIDPGGTSMGNFRRQMIALSCSRLQLGYVGDGGKVGQIDSKLLSRFEAWLPDEDGQRGFWPGELELSQPFFESLMSHAVPLDGEAIGKLQHSSFALDVYSWLAHRLCRVNSNAGLVLSWDVLKGQFGQELSETKEFRKEFLKALTKAHEVYRDARLEVVRGGLRLLPSPPPCRKERSVITLPSPAKKLAPPAPADLNTKTPVSKKDIFISSDALERLKEILPRADVHYLEAEYRKWFADKEAARNEDARFLKWAPGYYKRYNPLN